MLKDSVADFLFKHMGLQDPSHQLPGPGDTAAHRAPLRDERPSGCGEIFRGNDHSQAHSEGSLCASTEAGWRSYSQTSVTEEDSGHVYMWESMKILHTK